MVFTEKCDVYSFGVVTMEAVMGKHPKRSTSILLANRAEYKAGHIGPAHHITNERRGERHNPAPSAPFGGLTDRLHCEVTNDFKILRSMCRTKV